MKVADIRAMTLDQMDDEVLKLKKEGFNLRFQRATGQLENTSRTRQVRRDIARLKTVAAKKRAGAPEPKAKAEPKPKTKAAADKPKAAPKAKAKPAAKTKAASKDKSKE